MTIESPPRAQKGWVCINPFGQWEAGPYAERDDAERYREAVMVQLHALQRPHVPRRSRR